MQHCYACSEEALDQCKSCQQWFCARHGEGRCDRCRDLPGGYPSGLVYRGVLGTLVVALGLAGWHLWAWPQFPLPEPRMLAALAAAETNVLDVTPVEPTPAPTVAATATATATAAATAAATPAPSPTPTPTSTPTPTTLRYVVQDGDNLSTIAASFGVTVEVIIVANDIADPALIRVGAELIIPTTAALTPTPTRTTLRYVVQDGDNLSTIAASFGVTADAISAANDITDPALIGVGEELIIPTTATSALAPTPTLTTRRYVVQAGDSVNAIAASFGVTVEAIVAANDITDPTLLRVGEELIIPAATP